MLLCFKTQLDFVRNVEIYVSSVIIPIEKISLLLRNTSSDKEKQK